MKRIVAMLLTAIMAVTLFAGCGRKEADPINIGALQGPTGMGMVTLMGDEFHSKYNITIATAPDAIVGQIVSGELDVAAVPINLASTLYNKTEGNVMLIAVNTLGVLYVLEDGDTVNSMADLAGKKLYATGQGSTPEYMLSYLLEANGLTDSVTVEYTAEHSELATMMAAGEATLGMLPEPNVTATMVKNDKLRVALDLTEEWKSVAGIEPVQGCIVVRRDFFEENETAVRVFLKEYNAAVNYTNANQAETAKLMEQYGILPSAAIAEKAIDKCNIVCYRNAEMRLAAEGMLEVLFNANPKSVGGKLPGDDFYYVEEE
ncbi:MAG: ABC transporter substrate-binding protein [Clostridia bacterium]|nr:ABC transporter substrate-binding protein [Clostridia bacterium]MBQ6692150.1 ABC transporter substrate-binding protein [Clostridia bacterium]MBQ7114018.1 ABC transporter substrate-binding protein [Clostridia bacterium]